MATGTSFEATTLCESLENLINTSTNAGLDLRQAFVNFVRDIEGATIVGTRSQVIEFTRLLTADALAISLDTHPLVMALLNNLRTQLLECVSTLDVDAKRMQQRTAVRASTSV